MHYHAFVLKCWDENWKKLVLCLMNSEMLEEKEREKHAICVRTRSDNTQEFDLFYEAHNTAVEAASRTFVFHLDLLHLHM